MCNNTLKQITELLIQLLLIMKKNPTKCFRTQFFFHKTSLLEDIILDILHVVAFRFCTNLFLSLM